MKKRKIHQFAPTANRGDGITNGMFYLQKCLRQLGFDSEIYAERHDPALAERVNPHTAIPKDTEILFVHYSLYYDFSTWIERLSIPIHIIYHNITPPHFFSRDSELHTLCKMGLEYLPELATKCAGSIGDSELNTEALIEHNFPSPHTIPLLIDSQKVQEQSFDTTLFDEKSKEFSIIFVGRIAKNKSQHTLIEIAKEYIRIDPDFRLYIIGGTTDPVYHATLTRLIYHHRLSEHVILTGKLSDEALYAYYRSADLFLCMSEHEGFGMPLVESMLLNLPVFAYNSSNIKSTLNGGGVLFDAKEPKSIAAAIHLLRTRAAFRAEIIRTQKEAASIYTHQNIIQKLTEYLNIATPQELPPQAKKLRYQFEGPFDSSYSLALLNRQSALIFERHHSGCVSLFSTEGGGDYKPDESYLSAHPHLAPLVSAAQKAPLCQVTFRNLYPPRVTGTSSELTILNLYAWEESSFPPEYVKSFNENLDGIIAVSDFVKQTLIANGVLTPIEVIPNSIDHTLLYDPSPYALKTKKSFRFLHISSAFPRKGVDVLLRAYMQSFSAADDVTLIIKTFKNPHHSLMGDLATMRANNPNMPEVELILEDLSDAELKWLYQNSHALVAPSRAEGFGLPIAEAMLHHLPVIATGYSGMTHFCDHSNAWLIDFALERASSHLELFDSYWAEPSAQHLSSLMRELYSLPKPLIEQKTARAHATVSAFTWQSYYQRATSFIERLKEQDPLPQPAKLAWISSYNSKCGIATYSDFLLESLDPTLFSAHIFAPETQEYIDFTKEQNTTRCFGDRFDTDIERLMRALRHYAPTHIVLNFNFSFISTAHLAQLIECFSPTQTKLCIIFHSVDDVTIPGLEASLSDIVEPLTQVDTILLHTLTDIKKLHALGIKNTTLFPHGTKELTPKEPKTPRVITSPTIASYGFMLPHKGIAELIEAFAQLRAIYPSAKLLLVNALYPAEISSSYLTECKELCETLNVTNAVEFHSEFLDDEDSYALLSRADIVVMPYQNTNESASGAIRYAISTQKPTLCTPNPIFDDIKELLHFTAGKTPQDIYNSLTQLLANPILLRKHYKAQRSWIKAHSWGFTAQRLSASLLH